VATRKAPTKPSKKVTPKPPKSKQPIQPLNPANKGMLHKSMGVAASKKLNPAAAKAKLAKLEAKDSKTAADKALIKRLNFYINSLSWNH
jgi:hypothetical protein